MGFDINKARVIGWIGAESATDIFAQAGDCLKYRDIAIDFLSSLRTNFLRSLEYIDSIEKDHLSIFLDSIIVAITDLLLLHSSIENIVNLDRKDDLKKICKDLPFKSLLALSNSFSQIRSEDVFNLSPFIKSAAITFNEISI
jgi:hypothetical protein